MKEKPKNEPKKRTTSTSKMSEQAAEELWVDLFGNGEAQPPAEAGAIADGERDAAPAPINQGWADLELIHDNPFQPRAFINQERLKGMIKTMDEKGQLQPALARPYPSRPGHFQLCDGHRRRATVKAGANAGIKQPSPDRYIGKLLLHVQPLTDSEMLENAWAANEEREDFSVFDKARYYESLRLVETQRFARERLNPGSNAPNRGAAQTADGLLSWEELVAVRMRANKKIPGPRTLRNIAAVLELGDGLERQLSQINLAPESEVENGNFIGVTEKHCRALLLIKSRLNRSVLLAQIAAEKLSANETLKRAQAMQPAKKTATTTTAATENAASDDAPAQAEAQASSAQNSTAAGASSSTGATSSGVASTGASSTSARSAPMATTAKAPEPAEEVQGDIVAAYLQPARDRVMQAARVYKMLKTGPEYRDRAIQGLVELEAGCRELRRTLEYEKHEDWQEWENEPDKKAEDK